MNGFGFGQTKSKNHSRLNSLDNFFFRFFFSRSKYLSVFIHSLSCFIGKCNFSFFFRRRFIASEPQCTNCCKFFIDRINYLRISIPLNSHQQLFDENVVRHSLIIAVISDVVELLSDLVVSLANSSEWVAV